MMVMLFSAVSVIQLDLRFFSLCESAHFVLSVYKYFHIVTQSRTSEYNKQCFVLFVIFYQFNFYHIYLI